MRLQQFPFLAFPAPHPSRRLPIHPPPIHLDRVFVSVRSWLITIITRQTDRYAEMVVNCKFPSIVIVIFHNDIMGSTAVEVKSQSLLEPTLCSDRMEFPTNDNKVQLTNSGSASTVALQFLLRHLIIRRRRRFVVLRLCAGSKSDAYTGNYLVVINCSSTAAYVYTAKGVRYVRCRCIESWYRTNYG